MKVVGRSRGETKADPAEYRRRALVLQRQADRLNPYPKPRGFVFKGRTWELYEEWREEQQNPRLW